MSTYPDYDEMCAGHQSPLQQAVIDQINKIPKEKREIRSAYGKEQIPHYESLAMFQLMMWAIQEDREMLSSLQRGDLMEGLQVASNLNAKKSLKYMELTPDLEKKLTQEIDQAKSPHDAAEVLLAQLEAVLASEDEPVDEEE